MVQQKGRTGNIQSPTKFTKTLKRSTELRKSGPKPQRQPRHEIAEGSFGMTILDADYPNVLMGEAEMKEVECFLIVEVVEGWTIKIRIHNLKLGPGYLSVKGDD